LSASFSGRRLWGLLGTQEERLMKRMIRILSALLLLGAMVGAGVAPAAAVTNDTTIYAGRPINGYSYDSAYAGKTFNCKNNTYYTDRGWAHGIAYASVDNRLALLIPYHARDDHASECNYSYDGKNVYNQADEKIGTFAADVCYNGDCARDHDLAVIWIDAENKPAILNRVYRGPVAGASSYFDITGGMAPFDCADEPYSGAWSNDYTILQAFQYETDAPDQTYRTGDTNGWFNSDESDVHCQVKSTLRWHNGYNVVPCTVTYPCPYRDSGSPWVAGVVEGGVAKITIFGYSVLSFLESNGERRLVVQPLKDGLDVLDSYWKHQPGSSGEGAHLCQSSGCGLP